ncbi:hypothetical protein PHSY_002974 [Pseudozyma hubeiensis SY62]|uniref:Haem-binding uptake Tiki superfamily ChaN domain-containing protein n=1 Tax=Pseudozyma hubeiensis (strain SY62) TaxID=1305764 RepID=R9P2C6_PSEHS|nr:hypothetical protein PHSY_002974 [Pseudozyma hubeiensis SY62]GAC95399.1 hypothetical protein PHSY_002974 [Pseudozyma hubeiensis SY62]
MATTGQASGTQEEPLRAMSIARFIPRFPKPLLVTSNIPVYRHSFSLPIRQSEEPSSSPATSEGVADSDPRSAATDSASYVEWSKLLPVPSNLLGSVRELFETRLPRDAESNAAFEVEQKADDEASPPLSASPPPRLVFFGEQHHQPEVMRAQLQILHALHQQYQLASQPFGKHASAPPIYKLHLILEHFSVLDQHMLNSFSNDRLGPDELAEKYHTHSQEAFHIGHYMPLLMLAKELRVPIWGGFPPRSWARQVFRDGVESVKTDERRRADPIEESHYELSTADNPSQPASELQPSSSSPSAVPRSPLFTSWGAVTKIGAAHRSYLSALMRPDMPPRFPKLPTAASSGDEVQGVQNEEASTTDASIYPTWLLKPHNIETKGFGPAQALKDSYLAHVTSWILRGAHTDDPIPAHSTKQSTRTQPAMTRSLSADPAADADDSGRPIINVALVVCGLGHCEYGFGAPERVVELLSGHSEGSSHGDLSSLLPYIIASKPLDSGIWLGSEHPSQPSADNDNVNAKDESPAAVQRWLDDPWGRKLADAIVLYEWIDNEPAEESDGNADGGDHPTSG